MLLLKLLFAYSDPYLHGSLSMWSTAINAFVYSADLKSGFLKKKLANLVVYESQRKSCFISKNSYTLVLSNTIDLPYIRILLQF
ncbi:hypothetical protein BpHYR1_000692 [Brachionus plicatilis]|uniref:Uncharacterized protein n=1 Tax=Brachionus plicatilis TaxID=10195 RepID=A0A3M7T647_BRAPC|nr:hypothetical protein BpHYR1_000692 [Brachionus plicatilis]